MNIVDELNSKRATPETILQIMKTSVYEISGDVPPEKMLTILKSAANDSTTVDKALGELRANPELVRDIALLWIADASEDESTRGVIEGAIGDADREMPLLEVGALTLMALYAIYKMASPTLRRRSAR